MCSRGIWSYYYARTRRSRLKIENRDPRTRGIVWNFRKALNERGKVWNLHP
jgi:hypothetical protein